MTEHARTQQVTFFKYASALLAFAPRWPQIRRVTRKMERITIENRESWGSMIEENARRFPDNAAVKSEEGTLTYREFNQRINQYAHLLLSAGVQKGDTIIVFMENRPELLIAYSAVAKTGAVNSMINTNLRHDSLRHCMSRNPGAVFIIGEELIDAFEDVKETLGLVQNIPLYYVEDKGQREVPAGYISLVEAARKQPTKNPATTASVKSTDALAYVFTSGTTGGLPKAAIITHKRTVTSRYFNGHIVLKIKPTDTVYIPLPFFHTNALALSWPSVLANGAAVAIRRKFSVSRFWQDVVDYGVTVWCYVGELCRYLMNQQPRANDANNPLERIIGNGLRPDIWAAFKKRFGIDKVYEIYGAAESNLYFVNLLNLDCTIGLCRQSHAIVKYDVEEEQPIRDRSGFMQRVSTGQAGLLLGEILESNPFAGYTSREATDSKILRDAFVKGDLWFNTGDLIRDIGHGHAQFVDRLGDTFRWKGENVSTTEVEKAVNAFEQVFLSAVYGVSMPGGDGRVGMAAVVPTVEIAMFDLPRFSHHLLQALPSYAVPRFIRFLNEFDYTPTHKIKKAPIKAQGFELAAVSGPLYVLLPNMEEYTLLTNEIHEGIWAGNYSF